MISRISLLILAAFCLCCEQLHADPPPVGADSAKVTFGNWYFSDTNWINSRSHAPMAFTNIANVGDGNGNALRIDSTNAAFLQYRVVENNGSTNLAVDHGSLMFWFRPNWSSADQGGTGPGEWSRLLEVGSYTTNASYGWWSLYCDPAGTNLFFGAQTNDGSQATYLSAPISWASNVWHHIALTYSPTNSSLFIDGQLVTNSPGVSYRPGPDVLANGFFIGSDSNGLAQAHGDFDDLSTYISSWLKLRSGAPTMYLPLPTMGMTFPSSSLRLPPHPPRMPAADSLPLAAWAGFNILELQPVV